MLATRLSRHIENFEFDHPVDTLDLLMDDAPSPAVRRRIHPVAIESFVGHTKPNRVEISPWNENFATGIEIIDAQHKELADLRNTLVGHLVFQADTPAPGQVFNELKRYTVWTAPSPVVTSGR